MVLRAEIRLSTEELTELRRIAGVKGETIAALLDRCFQDAIEKEIREAAEHDQKCETGRQNIP